MPPCRHRLVHFPQPTLMSVILYPFVTRLPYDIVLFYDIGVRKGWGQCTLVPVQAATPHPAARTR